MTKVVKSLRVEPALWARVEAFAQKHGLKVNGAIERLLDLGLLPTSILATKQVAAAPKKADPDLNSRARWSLSAAGVQVGPGPRHAMPKPGKPKK